MKRMILLSVLFLFTACADKINSSELHHLNGYWEIQKVVFPKGDTKEYNLNTTIDYITFEDNKGYRKKVQPRLDGTFITSDDAASFRLIGTKGSFKLQYHNEFSEWEEQIIELSAEKLTVVNQENIRYYYKRHQTITAEK
ncbi:lipocalin family protein [Muriicola sp. Z0-33]|uniref:lipocalin family protein n=1 Tax=Muriicola sp. Z0-33 TaxID=2816957 RepID=UPI00223800DE|nr:lipocalin family protein [Muriicola sp. Z0-33]MCW5515827.1 lipocalin family protein [Muriicola sp. Z0-33]